MTRFWAHAYRQIPKDAAVAGKVGAAPMIGGPAGVAGVPGPWYLSVPQGHQEQNCQEVRQVRLRQQRPGHRDQPRPGRPQVRVREVRGQEGYESFGPLIETLNGAGHDHPPGHSEVAADRGHRLGAHAAEGRQPGGDSAALLADAQEADRRPPQVRLRGRYLPWTGASRGPDQRKRKPAHHRPPLRPAADGPGGAVPGRLRRPGRCCAWWPTASTRSRRSPAAPATSSASDNYVRAFTSPAFMAAGWRTLVYTMVVVALEFALGLGMALLFTALGRSSQILRTVFLYPLMIAPDRRRPAVAVPAHRQLRHRRRHC